MENELLIASRSSSVSEEGEEESDNDSLDLENTDEGLTLENFVFEYSLPFRGKSDCLYLKDNTQKRELID